MHMSDLHLALATAVKKDPSILTSKVDVDKTIGNDPRYLESLGLEKQHLQKLEKLGLALKARYATTNRSGRKYMGTEITGQHRTRWIIFQETVQPDVQDSLDEMRKAVDARVL